MSMWETTLNLTHQNGNLKSKPIKTSPWELMYHRKKNDSDKTQDIHIPFDPF